MIMLGIDIGLHEKALVRMTDAVRPAPRARSHAVVWLHIAALC